MSTNRLTRSTSVSSVNNKVLNANVLKRSREELDKSDQMDDVVNLADLWSKIQDKFASSAAHMDENFSSIEAKIETCKAELEERMDGIDDKLGDLKTDCNTAIQNISQSVSVIRHDLDLTTESVDRLGRSQDVLISGVPFLQNENLIVIFRNIAAVLGYKDGNTPIVSLKRLARNPIAPGAMPPIVCQFALRNVRDDFYRSYLNLRTLNLRQR